MHSTFIPHLYYELRIIKKKHFNAAQCWWFGYRSRVGLFSAPWSIPSLSARAGKVLQPGTDQAKRCCAGGKRTNPARENQNYFSMEKIKDLPLQTRQLGEMGWGNLHSIL